MSLESVRAFFREKAPDIEIVDQDASTATVAEAAVAFGVEPGRAGRRDMGRHLSVTNDPLGPHI